MRRNRRGFTLIEIITVVSIIAALMAMFFIGFRYVQGRAKGDQTKVAVQALRNMLTEYEVQGAAMKRINDLYPVTTKFDAPGLVAEGAADREGDAVRRTRLVMKVLLTIPANKKLLAELPGAQPSKDAANAQGDLVWRTKGADGSDEIVFLDSHRNPIIFVPRQGMTGVTQGGQKLTITSPGAREKDGVVQGAPFFAAAGDDGDFKAGDDNKYSFE